MPNRPIIAYVERPYESVYENSNPGRDALIYHLRNQCGCNVIVYDNEWDFEQDVAKLKRSVDFGVLVAVFFSDQFTELVPFIRQYLSEQIPILIIARNSMEHDDLLVKCVHRHEDPAIEKFVKDITDGWRPPLNWLGAETADEKDLIAEQLEKVYDKNYPEDDKSLYAPDHNCKIVTEALRIHLLTSELIGEEFDQVLHDEIPEFLKIDQDIYLMETEKIRQMTKEQRDSFSNEILFLLGYDNNGRQIKGAKVRNRICGFAIDPITFENITMSGYGKHELAATELVSRIQLIALMKSGNSPEGDELFDCRGRIIHGYILPKVEGFETPILCLWGAHKDPEDKKKVAKFLLQEKKFLVVGPDGHLFGI